MRQRPERVWTFGPQVADVNAAAGFAPDPQQELALDLIFAFRPDGSPVSFEVCLICARQNLKSGTLAMTVIGWVYVLDVPVIMWSAHEAKTSADAQDTLAEVLQGSPTLSKRLPRQKNHGIYDENGDERVEFSTDQEVMFRTRTKNGARGISRVHRLIVDEGLGLTSRQVGAMFPVVAAKPHPQIVVASSAGPVEAAVLRDTRDRGRAGTSARMSYLEWTAKREPCETLDCQHPKDAVARGIDCALDREHLLEEANPTLTTGRITMETLRGLRQALPPEEYMRECLTWWEEPGEHQAVISSSWWNGLRDEASKIQGRPTFGLEVAEDQAWSAIGSAGSRSDDRAHIELTSQPIVGSEDGGRLVDYRPGTDWVVGRAAQLTKRWDARLAIASGSAAMALKPELEAAGVPVDVVKHADAIAACGHMLAAVKGNDVVHLGQLPLTTSVAGARKRNVGDGAWAFGRRSSAADITPLWACVLALWQHHVAATADYDVLDSIG